MPRLNLKLLFVTFLLAPLFAGCLWIENDNFEGAVWADDGEGVAYISSSYMTRKSFGHNQKKDFHTRLRVADSDLENGQQVGSVMEGRATVLYYMKREGYLLVGRESAKTEVSNGQNPNEQRTITFDKMELDGTKIQVARETGLTMVSCDGGSSAFSGLPPVTVIPSPDGKTFAILKGASTCERVLQTLTFVDAHSLETKGETFDIDLDALVPGNVAQPALLVNLLPMAWLDDDNFMIGFGSFMSDMTKGWVYAAEEEPVWRENMKFDCLFPATSSSYVNENGQSIEVGSGGWFDVGPENSGPDSQTFGCSE